MNFNSELNTILNAGLFIGFASLWIFHVLCFYIPLLVPSCRDLIKLKDSDLNTISNFTSEVGVGFIIGLGTVSSLSSKVYDASGYIYALVSTLAFCLIWRYVRGHWVSD
jgi:hypothetical protein